VTVTRPHHPLHGQRFATVWGGPTHVVVRLGDGTSMRFPRAWCDADGGGSQRATETILSVEALRELIELVQAIGQRTPRT
jgi:Family of unknown function (DUF5372)